MPAFSLCRPSNFWGFAFGFLLFLVPTVQNLLSVLAQAAMVRLIKPQVDQQMAIELYALGALFTLNPDRVRRDGFRPLSASGSRKTYIPAEIFPRKSPMPPRVY